MSSEVYRYAITGQVRFADVEDSLRLAVLTTESLHGESRVRLDAGYAVDEEKRVIVIDGATEVGQHLNRTFVSFLRHEFGERAFEVQRIDRMPEAEPRSNAS